MRNVIIIGSGPAGLTAAIYAARAGLDPLVIGSQPGGQMFNTLEIENYPGFPDGVAGPDLMQRAQEQAQRFGAELVMDEVSEVELGQHPFTVRTFGGEHKARAIIVASGSSHRRLNVPGEREYSGKGVSYCAVCDGFFFREQVVGLVGGGDSAIGEALYLSRLASQVYVIHRRDRLRAGQILQDRAMANEKIELVWNSVVEEVRGEEKGVTGVLLKDTETDETRELALDGLFVAVGHIPNTEVFKGQLELDGAGYIVADKRQHTNIPGVFAAGDVQDPIFRQKIVAAGTGAAAAIEAERFIAEMEGRAYPGRSA